MYEKLRWSFRPTTLSFYLCRYSILPLLPSISAELGAGYDELAAALSMLYAGYALALSPSGLAAAVVGAWRPLLVGAVMAFSVNILMALASDLKLLALLLLVNGLA